MINMHSKPVNFKEEMIKKCKGKKKCMKERKIEWNVTKGGCSQ